MYQSADKLVSKEEEVPKSYQSTEGGAGPSSNEPNVPEVPQTFLSQVKRAREENVGCCNFCLAFFALLLGSILWTIVLIVIITVPVILIIIGAEYFHDCPVEKFIPISLIVAGCVGMLSNILNVVDRYRTFFDSSMPRRHTVIGWINVFLNLFLFAWFIAMCYWVYGANAQFEPNEENYCNPRLYGFVYWFLNFIFIFLGSMIIVSGLVMCFAIICW